MNAIERLFHRHEWRNTRTNPYGIPTEQRCACGKYRHHTSTDLSGVAMGDSPKWRVGRHPAETDGVTQVPRLNRATGHWDTVQIIGTPLVYGVREPLPLRGFPEGRARIRMRPGKFVRVYVRPLAGGVREFVVQERDGAWWADGETGANRTAKRLQDATQGGQV